MDELKKDMLKTLPKIDEVLLILEKQNIYDLAPRNIVKETCRRVVQDLRDKIVNAKKKLPAESCPDAEAVAQEVERSIKGLYRYSLRRVVNATGVILHTNLGRAPLCPKALALSSPWNSVASLAQMTTRPPLPPDSASARIVTPGATVVFSA